MIDEVTLHILVDLFERWRIVQVVESTGFAAMLGVNAS